MFNFQGLSKQKTVENFDVKVLAASRIKLSQNAKNTISLTDDKQVFLDKDVTTNSFWIAAVQENGKKLTSTNTFGHKVLNQALGENTEWKIDILNSKEHDGVTYFPLSLIEKEIEEPSVKTIELDSLEEVVAEEVGSVELETTEED